MSDNETVKVNVGIQVNYISNSTREDEVDTGYTRAQWDAMSEEERDKAMEPLVEEHIADNIAAWWAEAE